jgi:hypothetical protein
MLNRCVLKLTGKGYSIGGQSHTREYQHQSICAGSNPAWPTRASGATERSFRGFRPGAIVRGLSGKQITFGRF